MFFFLLEKAYQQVEYYQKTQVEVFDSYVQKYYQCLKKFEYQYCCNVCICGATLSLEINQTGRFQELLKYCDQVIQKNPENPEYYLTKQLLQQIMHRFEEALQYYDSAIQKNPENSNHYLNKVKSEF